MGQKDRSRSILREEWCRCSEKDISKRWRESTSGLSVFQDLVIPEVRHIPLIALDHCPFSCKIAQNPYDQVPSEFKSVPVGLLSLAIKTVSTNRLQILNMRKMMLRKKNIFHCVMLDVHSILRKKSILWVAGVFMKLWLILLIAFSEGLYNKNSFREIPFLLYVFD